MSPSTASPTTCPDLEDLAAFVDGELSGEERGAVVEHLASCEDCYEVYAETLRVQEDLGPRAVPLGTQAVEEEPAELAQVVVHPRSFGWAWKSAATLAAAAALTLMVRLLWFSPTTPVILVADLGTIISTPLTEDSPPEGEWYEHDWPRKRGGGSRFTATERDAARRAFRLGVLAVDLETAVRVEDLDTAGSQTVRIDQLLEDLEFPQLLMIHTQELRDLILADAPQKDLLAAGSRLEEELTRGDVPIVDPFYFSFGRWTEASRLAVLKNRSEYFLSRDYEKALRRIQQVDLAKNVASQIQVIEGLVTEGPDGRLESALEEIIRLEGVR